MSYNTWIYMMLYNSSLSFSQSNCFANISSRFSFNSEASASELLENLEEMFPQLCVGYEHMIV